LDLIDDPSLMVNERNLIEAQNIWDFFKYSITPLESKFQIFRISIIDNGLLVHRHPNSMHIIPTILKSNPRAYKNTCEANQSIISIRYFIVRDFS
jgi:hypothetical protein